MALSDEKTQREMREKALSFIPMNSGLFTDYLYVPAAGMPSSSVIGGPSTNSAMAKR
jgi:hypothetical protein